MIHDESAYDYLGTHHYAYAIDVWQSGNVRVYDVPEPAEVDEEQDEQPLRWWHLAGIGVLVALAVFGAIDVLGSIAMMVGR